LIKKLKTLTERFGEVGCTVQVRQAHRRGTLREVAENYIAYWKAVSAYTDAEADAVDKFKEDLVTDELVIHIATGELVRPCRGGDT
jgi:hypothetical protein